MKHLIPLLFLLISLPIAAQQPSAADRAGILAHFNGELGDAYPEGLNLVEYHGIDLDGDGEDEWIALFNGWGTSFGYGFDTNPLRLIPPEQMLPLSRPGVEIELEVMDVNQDGKAEAMLYSGGGGTFSHDLNARLIGMRRDSLYLLWWGRISSIGREKGQDELNALRFERDKKERIRRIEFLPARAGLGDSIYNRSATVTSDYPRFQWDWVDSTMSFHPRIKTVQLDLPGQDKYLKLETMDVIFYQPYHENMVDELLGEGFGKWMREWPVMWTLAEKDAAWTQFEQVKARFESEEQVDVTEYREFSILLGYFLEQSLSEGTAHVFDKASHAYLRDIRRHAYPEYYACECMDGSLVKGHTWKLAYFAHTPNTAYLYFYTRQSGESEPCCMEEWPYESNGNN